ncbi:MAG: hypothetical protein HY796_09650 [Elusimicrobia bacterium]|nr:hypothetical protein [Elusimicrobiota bacterium]
MKAILKISVLSIAFLFSSLVFYFVPPGCEAAVTPVRIVQIAVTMPQSCEAGVMEQLCSSVTSFLNDEAAKAATALKNCTKNCNWKKHKDELVKAAQKKAKDSCAKGEAPDINDINNGLDTDAKARLKSLYDRNSRMFDGTAKLAAKDFDVKSNQSSASTGKGGQVSDLKSSEPDIKKITSPSEFSLANKSTTLPASAKTAPTSTPKASAQAASYIFWCSCPQDDTGTLFETTDYSDCVKQCCEKYHGGTDCPSGDGGSDIWKKLKEMLNSIIKALREIKDAAAIALRDKFVPLEKRGDIAWVECDGKGGFRIDFPGFNQKLLKEACDTQVCTLKHEAAHIRDAMNAYPDRCKGEPENKADLWTSLDQIVFRKKSECRATLEVDLPCMAGKLASARTNACKADLKYQINYYKKFVYNENQCDTRFGYPTYFEPYPGY